MRIQEKVRSLRMKERPDYWPRERVAPIVLDFIYRHTRDRPLMNDEGRGSSTMRTIGPMQYLAAHTGMSERQINRICYGVSPHDKKNMGKWVKFDNVEKILEACDREYLLYHPPEDGGFLDLYDGMFNQDQQSLDME